MRTFLLTLALCSAAQFTFAQMEKTVELVNFEKNTPATADASAIKAAHSQQALIVLQNYIQNNIQYPEELKAYGEEGIVFINIAINASGKIVSTEILESFSPVFSQHVLNKMKQCDLSAILNHDYLGNSRMVFPVAFNLR